MGKTFEIAVLLTCHNRREKTLNCLDSLFKASFPEGYIFDVYLVDDGSTDGTGDAIKEQFPQVVVIHGDGSLFWNQGMRLAWDTAVKRQEYDFYLWLNDDTMMDKIAINELLDCYHESLEKDKNVSIVAGACRSPNGNEFTYGGETDEGPVIPNGILQQCKYTNGNVTLVPKKIYEKLGNLSPDYTHAMGDFDYGLRAIQAGFHCYTTRKYIAVCSGNGLSDSWFNPELPLLKRWKLMNSPKGLNLKEYNVFRQKFWGWRWIIFTLKVYLKVIFPNMYLKISGK